MNAKTEEDEFQKAVRPALKIMMWICAAAVVIGFLLWLGVRDIPEVKLDGPAARTVPFFDFTGGWEYNGGRKPACMSLQGCVRSGRNIRI